MWNLIQAFLGHSEGQRPASSPNATVIGNEQLLGIYGQSQERLILFDLRHPAELEKFPFVIPGALLTTRVTVLELADWIPPQAIVVLYGADHISAYSDLIERLPHDAHFYLLEGGVKAWQHARLPMEDAGGVASANAPKAWARDSGSSAAGEGDHV